MYGLAHIGVLQVLERCGLLPDVIAGTSAGAVVAGLWASGVNLTRMESETTEALMADESHYPEVRPMNASAITQKGLTGLVGGGAIEATINRLTCNASLRDARIPLAITSVDIVTGSLIVFTNDPPMKQAIIESLAMKGRIYVTDARIAEAARASVSIPGVFTPKAFGEFTLVDGGIRDMVPVFEVRRMGAAEAIGVDLGLHVDRPHKPSNLVSVVSRSFSLSARETTQRNLQEYATMTLQPDVVSVTGLLTPTKARNLVSAGRVCAERALERLARIVA